MKSRARMTKAFHLIVYGVVQGVGFRYFTRIKASELGVCGTVRNLEDGSVEIFAEAKEDTMNEFIEWCHSGPNSAVVERLMFEECGSLTQSDFRILR